MAFRLPRLLRGAQLIDRDGQPTKAFQQWWQSFAKTIENQEASQDTLLAAIQAVQDDQAAQLALITAAQATADTVTRANDISASWIAPASVLSASDAGSDATITIADFTRVYDVAPAVGITGGSLTGLAYSTTYAIYYDDPTQSDTTPTFVAATNPVVARHNYIPGRHYVDTITTPTAGGGGTSGGGYEPPGGGGGGLGGGYVEP